MNNLGMLHAIQIRDEVNIYSFGRVEIETWM